ncbi:uncharacterized protein [Henckelia pumila]|uniref:uncharacterized protein n=1 Tax=Henckelia pumila TaxID=405737 RepID=UPI003C6DF8EE
MESKGEHEQKPMFKPKLPYPRFKKKELDEQFTKFLEIFKKLHINIPFADALLQMPNYGKFLKEVMSLGLGEVKSTTITLQLADRSLTYPREIIKDVLVKINKCIFLADFVVLDMEEDANIPLILGIPFLDTTEAKIDVKKGELTMDVDGEKVTFSVFKEARNLSKERVFMIEQVKRMESYAKLRLK